MKNPEGFRTFLNKDASSLLLSLGCLQCLLFAEMCEFSFSSGSCRDFGDEESGVQVLGVTVKIHKEFFPESRHTICKPSYKYWKTNAKIFPKVAWN